MSAAIQLPIELIVGIVAVVAHGVDLDCGLRRYQRHPLASASLVSRSWNAVCRPHVFHYISISTDNIRRRLHFLHFEASHLSEFIQAVRLWWDEEPDSSNAAWYPDVFGRLKNLRALHLEYGISWLIKDPGSLTVGISSMFTAPRLRKLVFRGWYCSHSASDLLAILPVTLEELVLLDVTPTSNYEAKPKSTLRLEALRSLDIQGAGHPMLGFQEFIECPNLERLTARLTPSFPWDLPPWIPHSLHELVLHAAPGCAIPNFGRAIRPSIVNIHGSQTTSYSEFFIWIEHCIQHLPFPNSIQNLTLSVTRKKSDNEDHSEALSPTPSEYGLLSQFLLQLHEEGGLEAIFLDITATVDWGDAGLFVDEVRELARLETGFAPLLKKGVLNVGFFLEGWGIRPPIRIMCCGIQSIEGK